MNQFNPIALQPKLTYFKIVCILFICPFLKTIVGFTDTPSLQIPASVVKFILLRSAAVPFYFSIS